MTFISSDNSILIQELTSCKFDFKTNPISSLITENSSTITLTGNGTTSSKLNAAVKISTTLGNLLTVNASGLFVDPLSIPVQTPLIKISVTDAIAGYLQDKIQAGTNIVINKITTIGGEKLVINSTGAATPLTYADTSTIDLNGQGIVGDPLTATVKLSTTAGNSLITNSTGLYVPTPSYSGESALVTSDSSSLAFVTSGTSGHSLTGNVKISTSAGNTLVVSGNGLFVPVANLTQTPISATNTSSINFVTSGANQHDISASIVISPDGGNNISIRPNGVYVSPSSAQTPISVTNSNSIEILTSGTAQHNLIPSLKVSAQGGNQIAINPDGVFVPNNTSPVYTAGAGISITGNIISSTVPVYTAGTNISITGNVISATVPVYTAGTNISITGNVISATGGTTNYESLTNLPVFSNGIVKVGTAVKLGGTLDSNTSIDVSTYDLSISKTVTALNGYNYASYYALGLSASGSETNQRLNCGLAGALGMSNTATFTPNISSKLGGIVGEVFKSNGGTVSGVLSSFFADAQVEGGGDVSTIVSYRSIAPKQTNGKPAYSGTVTNFAHIYLDDTANSDVIGRITNKYAIYQVGTNDINRFFGPVQNAGGTTQFTSDVRIKENFDSFTRGLKEIEQIDTHTFNYKYNKDSKVTGIIAQELEQIIPEAISKGNFELPDGSQKFNDFRMVDQNVLFYTMLNAIKELSAKIKILELKNN